MQISDDRWDRINNLLNAALELPPGERAAYLDAECDGEPEVRQEVEALLRADAEGPAFLEGDVVSFAGPAYGGNGAGAPPSHVDRRIGAYRLVEEVGRGGMSRVFRAERVDGAYEQTVAVKLLRVGLDTEAARQRVRLERQVLATLDHPNIAGLLDGGLTDDDVPYLAMEYVEGQPLTAYCDEHRCSVDERLRMLRTVADALSYAHRNMVVHRDLKPSNILVTDDGQVKVLDFGIAKLLDAEAAGVATPATRTGVRPMTPAYAAPEQVRGEAISTATDVYQLGVLAYELLTGRRPYGAGERTAFEVEQAVREEDPARPSTVVGTASPSAAAEQRGTDPESISAARGTTPGALSRTLEGDLDAILLKALRKDPDARYGSPDALRADLERYADGQPVQARSITWGYRLRKFARRHRGSVLAGTAGLLAVIAFVALLLHQRSMALEERDRARTEAQTTEQVSGFLVDLFEASNPIEEGDELTARELLRRGEQRVENLTDRPAVQARMLGAMGRAHVGLGNYTKADSLFRRTLDVRRQRFDAPHPEIADGLNHRAEALEKGGEYAQAESLAQQSLQMRRAVYVPPHPDIAESLNDVALYKKRQGDYAPAESLYHEALSMRKRVHEAPHRDVAATMNNLGQLLTERGDYAIAESLHTKTLALRKELLGNRHPEVGESLNNLAQTIERQGQLARAESLYRETLALDRARLGAEHPEIAIDLNNLAVTIERQGRLAEAESLKRESLAMRRALLGKDHPDVTSAMNNLAVLLRKKGAYEEAATLFSQVLDRLEEQFGKEHPYVAFTTGNLGDTRFEQEQLSKADSLYRVARDMIGRLFDDRHPHVATSLSDLADVRVAQERYEDAAAFHREALAIRREEMGKTDPKTVQSLTELADVKMDQRQTTVADSLYRVALARYREALPPDDWRTARVRSKLGACLVEQGRYTAAESTLKDGLQVLVDQRGASDEHTTEAMRHLIDLYETWEKPDSVSTYQQRLAAATASE